MKTRMEKYHWMFDCIRGSSLLACGGGLSYPQQYKQLLGMAKTSTNFDVRLLPVSALGDSDWVVTCGEVGPTHLPPISKAKISEMIQKLEQLVDKPVRAFLAYEMGQESIIFDAAMRAGFPIVDADVAGGRAVPSLNLVAPVLHKKSYSFSPLVAVNDQGKLSVLPTRLSADGEEAWLRQLSIDSKGIIFFVGGLVNGEFVRKNLINGSLSQAIDLGRKLAKGEIPAWYRGSFRIASVVKQTSGGFLTVSVKLISKNTNLIILIQNENLLVTDAFSQSVIACAPEIIVLVDSKEKRGLNSGELKKGMLVDVYVGQANDQLYDPRSQQAWKTYIDSVKKTL